MRVGAIAVAAVVGIVWTEGAHAQHAACTPLASTTASVKIDANTGRVLQGSTQYPEGEALQVLVVNKNPFKYEYRIEVTSRPLSEAIAVDFFSMIPGFGLPALAASGVPGVLPAGGACAGEDTSTWAALQKEVAKGVNLEAAVKQKTGIADEYNQFLKSTDVESFTETRCHQVMKTAVDLEAKLPGVIDLGNLAAQVADYGKSGPAALALFEAAVKAGTITAGCVKNLGADVANARKIGEHATALNTAVQAIVAKKQEFDTLRILIGAVAGSSDAFQEQHFPPTQDEPTGVRVFIARKHRRVQNATEQQIATIAVQVGRSRLSIGAGLAFSTVAQRRIIRQAGLVPTAPNAATTKTATVFGQQFDSEFGPRPMIALNASLAEFPAKRFGAVAVGLTTGAVIGAADDALQVEYLIGPSIGFLQNRVVLQFGVHFARLEELAGGFKIGEEIPASLQDPLPIQRDWQKGVALGVTYRVR